MKKLNIVIILLSIMCINLFAYPSKVVAADMYYYDKHEAMAIKVFGNPYPVSEETRYLRQGGYVEFASRRSGIGHSTNEGFHLAGPRYFPKVGETVYYLDYTVSIGTFKVTEVNLSRGEFSGYFTVTERCNLTTTYKKGILLESNIEAEYGSYPNDGRHIDGYWYIRKGTVNKKPELTIKEPLSDARIGNQDNLIISGNIKDEDIGQKIVIKSNIGNLINQNIKLIQPPSIISNGQNQHFEGYIQLNGISLGKVNLDIWAEDNLGAQSNKIKVPLIIFNTLENILDGLNNYVYKSGEPQVFIINSNNRIVQSIENDRLIDLIKAELNSKNIKLFFIGQDNETENYIKSMLLK